MIEALKKLAMVVAILNENRSDRELVIVANHHGVSVRFRDEPEGKKMLSWQDATTPEDFAKLDKELCDHVSSLLEKYATNKADVLADVQRRLDTALKLQSEFQTTSTKAEPSKE